MSDLNAELQRLIDDYEFKVQRYIAACNTPDMDAYNAADRDANQAAIAIAIFCVNNRAALRVLAPDERVIVPLAYGHFESAANPERAGQWIKVGRIDNPHWIVHTNDAAPRPDGDNL